MSSQREWNLNNFLGEVSELKERAEKVFPSYLASLKRIPQLPDEFERRWWASRIEALLARVRTDYQKWQAQAQRADFLGKFMTLGIDVVLKAGGVEPIAPPASPRIGISMSPSGKIEPTLIDDLNRQPDAILITFEKFEAITQRLRDEILKGIVMPKSENEIPKLIYSLAAGQK